MSATMTTGILLVAAGRLTEALKARRAIADANTRADDALLLGSCQRHAERLQAEGSLLAVEGPVLVVGPMGEA